MSVLDHPSFRGDGQSAKYVCPARRPVRRQTKTGEGAGGEATWYLDCVLRRPHEGLHEDIRGKRWESTTV